MEPNGIIMERLSEQSMKIEYRISLSIMIVACVLYSALQFV